MNVAVAWGDDNLGRLRLTYSRNGAGQDVKKAISRVAALLDQHQRPVHLLIDQQAAGISAGEFLSHLSSLRLLAEHPKTQHVVIVGANAETQALCHSYPAFHHYHFTGTLQDGHRLLDELEYLSSLENLQIIGDFFPAASSG